MHFEFQYLSFGNAVVRNVGAGIFNTPAFSPKQSAASLEHGGGYLSGILVGKYNYSFSWREPK